MKPVWPSVDLRTEEHYSPASSAVIATTLAKIAHRRKRKQVLCALGVGAAVVSATSIIWLGIDRPVEQSAQAGTTIAISGEWSVQGYSKGTVSKVLPTPRPTVEFKKDGTVLIENNCTADSGRWYLKETKLVIFDLGTPNVACLDSDGNTLPDSPIAVVFRSLAATDIAVNARHAQQIVLSGPGSLVTVSLER